MHLVPLLAILLSVISLVLFIVCGLAALGPDSDTASRMMTALIAYASLCSHVSRTGS